MNELIKTQTHMSADPASVAAAETAKTKLQAAFQMALYQPRNVEQARQNLLAACRRPKFAEKAEYSKPVGGTKIEGPSIRFAETAIREWGNILSDISVVFEDQSTRRIRVNMIDLQTNAQFTKELTISKTVERRYAKDREVLGERENSMGEKVFIVKATDDEIANKEAAMISKAVRNEGLRLIPSDIIEECLDTARETLKKQIKDDPSAHKRKVIDAFASLGIKVSSLEQFLGHEMDSCSPSEIADLRNIFGSLKDGEATWASYMELKKKTASADEEERKSAVSALGALANRDAAQKKKAEPSIKPNPAKEKKAEKEKAETKEQPKETPKSEEKPAEEPAKEENKGVLLAETMRLLKEKGRDQKDLIEWAIRNKHIEKAESIQDFPDHLLKKINSNWSKIVL